MLLVARYTERLTPTLLPLDGAAPGALHEASPGTDASLGGFEAFSPSGHRVAGCALFGDQGQVKTLQVWAWRRVG